MPPNLGGMTVPTPCSTNSCASTFWRGSNARNTHEKIVVAGIMLISAGLGKLYSTWSQTLRSSFVMGCLPASCNVSPKARAARARATWFWKTRQSISHLGYHEPCRRSPSCQQARCSWVVIERIRFSPMSTVWPAAHRLEPITALAGDCQSHSTLVSMFFFHRGVNMRISQQNKTFRHFQSKARRSTMDARRMNQAGAGAATAIMSNTAGERSATTAAHLKKQRRNERDRRRSLLKRVRPSPFHSLLNPLPKEPTPMCFVPNV